MSESAIRHTAVRMSGRDPHQRGRATTPLELLFDLSFVVAFGTAADQLAHFLAEDHVREGILGFCFAGSSRCTPPSPAPSTRYTCTSCPARR